MTVHGLDLTDPAVVWGVLYAHAGTSTRFALLEAALSDRDPATIARMQRTIRRFRS